MKKDKKSIPNDQGSLNYQWAFKLINYFSKLGVTQAVISPGSRSTPLALACVQHTDITTWVQVDERCAGFYALGLSQQGTSPALLICTSGSAVANWFPALIEANYSYTPLILLSADRPQILQNCGANQCIDQKAIFGSHVRGFYQLDEVNKKNITTDYLNKVITQAYSTSVYNKPGPVQVNIPFMEPLLPSSQGKEDLNSSINKITTHIIKQPYTERIKQNKPAISSLAHDQLLLLKQVFSSKKGIIICGRLSNNELKNLKNLLQQVVKRLNCPILLDPLSNLRFDTIFGANAITNYDHFLSPDFHNNKTNEPNWILRLGQFPVSKNLMLYLSTLSSKCFKILVNSYNDQADPLQQTDLLIHQTPSNFCQQIIQTSFLSNDLDKNSEIKNKYLTSWTTSWTNMEESSKKKLIETLNSIDDLFEGHTYNLLLKQIPQNSLLFSGNSMAIRDFDTFITGIEEDLNCEFHANRGASGIDGNISTFLGQLAQCKKYGVIVLGDLSFYHDMNALLITKTLTKLGYSGSIIVINNSGGGIFNYLPQKQLSDFDLLWNTDTELDFEYSAKLYALNYVRVTSINELTETIKPELFKQKGFNLIEVIVNQEISVECHKKLYTG